MQRPVKQKRPKPPASIGRALLQLDEADERIEWARHSKSQALAELKRVGNDHRIAPEWRDRLDQFLADLEKHPRWNCLIDECRDCSWILRHLKILQVSPIVSWL
jgi:hypothetical protein